MKTDIFWDLWQGVNGPAISSALPGAGGRSSLHGDWSAPRRSTTITGIQRALLEIHPDEKPAVPAALRL